MLVYILPSGSPSSFKIGSDAAAAAAAAAGSGGLELSRCVGAEHCPQHRDAEAGGTEGLKDERPALLCDERRSQDVGGDGAAGEGGGEAAPEEGAPLGLDEARRHRLKDTLHCRIPTLGRFAAPNEPACRVGTAAASPTPITARVASRAGTLEAAASGVAQVAADQTTSPPRRTCLGEPLDASTPAGRSPRQYPSEKPAAMAPLVESE